MLAEHCREFGLPFDLMIGVNRRVYEKGVYQGQDLFDQRTSLIQYAELFNAFPEVTFPISVLTSGQNQELVSYAWIFPNVVTERALVVLEHPGVHRARTCASRLAGGAEDEADRLLLATRTSWSSCCRSTTCTAASWPRRLADDFVRPRRSERDGGGRAGQAAAARQRAAIFKV